MPCKLFVVRLTGGSHAGEGNVYAYNPALGKEGPVCEDYWNMAAVSSYLEVLDLISRWPDNYLPTIGQVNEFVKLI